MAASSLQSPSPTEAQYIEEDLTLQDLESEQPLIEQSLQIYDTLPDFIEDAESYENQLVKWISESLSTCYEINSEDDLTSDNTSRIKKTYKRVFELIKQNKPNQFLPITLAMQQLESKMSQEGLSRPFNLILQVIYEFRVEHIWEQMIFGQVEQFLEANPADANKDLLNTLLPLKQKFIVQMAVIEGITSKLTQVVLAAQQLQNSARTDTADNMTPEPVNSSEYSDDESLYF